jgi:uncharacterized protein YbjT (DUF2867 family)
VDEKLSRSGLSFTILRPHSFFQNTLFHTASVASDGVIYGASQNSAIPMIDLRDVALTAFAVLNANGHSGRIYDLTGPEALTQAQVAEKLSAVVDRPVRYVDVPPGAFREGLQGKLPDWLADALLELTLHVASGRDVEVTDAVERITGKKPRAYDQFARDYAAAFGVSAKAVAT